MKLLRCLGLSVLCAATSMLAAADAVAAKSSEPGVPRGAIAAFFLEGSDGYEVQVLTLGQRVLLEAKRENVAAAYVVRGRVSAERIDARFGNLGRIAVEFRPFGGEGRGSGRCRRRSPLEIGFFRGTIKFRGEQEYTTIDARSAFGLVLDPSPKRCPRRSRAGASALLGRPELDTYLTAISKRKGTATSFELSRKRGQPRLSLTASRQERRDGMEIFRQSSTVVGGENAFMASGPGVQPAFAFVAAPKPFSGSALYETGPGGSSSWTGTLAAWLPGAGKVGLTGKDFALSFCRRASDEPGCNPLPPVRKPLSMLQASGSQSQALGEARLSWSRYLLNSASSAGSTP